MLVNELTLGDDNQNGQSNEINFSLYSGLFVRLLISH